MDDDKGLPTVEEAIEEVRRKPLVDLWPTVGLLLGCSRGTVYEEVTACHERQGRSFILSLLFRCYLKFRKPRSRVLKLLEPGGQAIASF